VAKSMAPAKSTKAKRRVWDSDIDVSNLEWMHLRPRWRRNP
jgi:hypothetical protein